MRPGFIIGKALSIIMLLAFIGICPGIAQVIEQREKITIPVPPATSQVITSSQNITYRSWQEIEILSETDIQQGANVVFEVMGLVTPPSNPDANLNMNWILSRSFDASGNVTGESKRFFNRRGLALQTQTRNINTGHVLASQVIYDQYGRPAINTMLAPTINSAFNYKSDFVINIDGTVYAYRNFDILKINTPDPVGNATPGTLGWYYSDNNTLDGYVPSTAYPYSRTDFYFDGTGAVKRSAGVGEALRMGNGHESSSYKVAVINELSHYFQVRNKFFPGTEVGASPSNILNGARATIVHDANGREAVSISSSDGKLLMSAYPGSGGLSVTNSVNLASPGDITSTTPSVHYFKLLAPSVVNVTGSYALYNMGGDEGQVSFTSGGTLGAGYYRVLALSGAVTLSYTNSFVDIAYNFYNQLGQQIGSIAPEGVEKLLGTGINNYTNKAALPFTTLNAYDMKGRLISRTSVDGGKTEYVYRADGKLRFSQNARQVALAGKPYSFTSYDPLGRAVKSGEFTPAASGGIAFNAAGMSTTESLITDNLEGLGAGTQTEMTTTTYDVPDPAGTGVTGYTQDDIFLTNGVSYTTGASGSKTWYSYDEQSRVVWIIQDIPGLGKKTIDYTYGVLGNITKVVYQKGTAAETFVHYYEYDADQRLSAVYTNTTDNPSTKVVQAKYEYYLHGPLKRVELGNSVQGTDYTYTAQGWLKTINHGNRDQDPGRDGISGTNVAFAKDAFGMNLEYYNGDYTRANSGIGSIPLAATVADDQYTGNIKGMGWYSRKPQSVIAALGTAIENPTMYGFKYDSKYQLNAGTWGSPNYNNPGFAASNAFKEYNLAYDANGNIQTLARTGEAGTVTDNFAYSYQTNSNRLQSVTNGGSTYSTYGYDALGQLMSESPGSGAARYIKYDVTGKVLGVYGDAAYTQPKVTFIYNENGDRIVKKDLVNNLTTYYVPDEGGQVRAIYTQVGTGTVSQSEIPVYANGRIGLYRRSAGLYEYELSDQVGTVRVVIDQNRNIKQYGDYYPFGYELRRGGTTDYRFGYQGQNSEKDNETGWNAFELRMYDSRIGRWLSVDPAGQYYSPYVAMGNDPVNRMDPDGGFDQDGDEDPPALKGYVLKTFEAVGHRSKIGSPILLNTDCKCHAVFDWKQIWSDYYKDIDFAKGQVMPAQNYLGAGIDWFWGSKRRSPITGQYVNSDGYPLSLKEVLQYRRLEADMNTIAYDAGGGGPLRGITTFGELMESAEAARYEAYWANYAPTLNPGVKRMDFYRISSRTGRMEKSRVIYDDYGRQIYRVDLTDHMRGLGKGGRHSFPHLHEYIYNKEFWEFPKANDYNFWDWFKNSNL